MSVCFWRSEDRDFKADGPANEKTLSLNFSFVFGLRNVDCLLIERLDNATG